MSVENFVIGQKVRFKREWMEKHLSENPDSKVVKWNERPYFTVTKVETYNNLTRITVDIDEYDGCWTDVALTVVQDAFDGENFPEHEELFKV